MDPTDRIIEVIEGKELDRVQTFIFFLDDHPIHQVLGKPLIPPKYWFFNPVVRFILDRWGKKLSKYVMPLVLDDMMLKSIEAAVKLGFDAVWGYYVTPIFKLYDSKTLVSVWGSFHNLIDDGYGNLSYMYRGPAITSPEAFEKWPYFPDTDEWADGTFKFFKKALSKFGDKICIMGDTCTGINETILHSMGFEKMVIYIRRNPDFIRRFIALYEEYIMKNTMAMMDAGIRVVIKSDDMGFKTGPQMNPKLYDEFYGHSYTRLCKAVHDRGGKILLHSCGDNTMLFDYFIKWGFDGGHAFETTSNVDIPYEKKAHGDRFTMIGGIGVDYLLTKRSKAEEVIEATKEIIRICAPGGRFLLAPVHSHSDLDISKVKVMLETAKKYGRYPITI